MNLAEKFQRVAGQEGKLADILDKTTWSQDFSWEELQILGSYMELFAAAEGSIIFEQGAKDLFMGLIIEGEITVLKEDAGLNKRPLATIGRDKTLGEMALIDNQPRSAAAIASKDTTMLVLTKERFALMAETHPRLWGSLLLKFAQMMSQRLRRTSGLLIDYLDSEPASD